MSDSVLQRRGHTPMDCLPLVTMNIIGMLQYLTLSGQGSAPPWTGDCDHAGEGATVDRPPVANKNATGQCHT